VALWVVVPVAATLVVAVRYGRTWYFYDEWSLTGQILGSHGSLGALFTGYNGHLYLVPRLVYAAQLFWVGTPNHALVWTVFCLTILGWIYAVALLLRQLKVPTPLALVAAAMIVTFGPGAQLVAFEINFSTDGALALGLLAAWVSLRHRDGRKPAAVVAALLALAVCFDSGAGTLGLVFVAVLTVGRRPVVEWAIALGPPAALAAWAALALPGPSWSAGLGTEAHFALTLVLLAAGGLVGGTEVAGVVVLVVAVPLLVVGFRAGALAGDVGRALVAGTVAAAVTVGVLTHTRAGLVHTDLAPYNRYVGEVAVFLLVALLPSLWATAVALRPGWRPALTLGTVAAVVLVYALNLPGVTGNLGTIEGFARVTRDGYPQAVAVAALRCPSGRPAPSADAPLGADAPQLTVALLHRMTSEGLFTTIHPAAPTPAMLAAACPSASHSHAGASSGR
jgi:hypothetical protein